MRIFRSLLVCLVIPLPVALSQSGPGSSDALVFKSDARYTRPIPEIPPVPVPGGKLLVTVGHIVFMVGPDGKVIWRYESGGVLTAQPAFRADRNEIGIVDSDLTFAELDASTGKLRMRHGSNGAANYVDVKAYRDGYVVLVDMSAYREKFKGDASPESKDELDYWGKSEDDQWTVEFRIGAQLAITGEQIYAVTNQGNTVSLQKIEPGSFEK